MQRKGVCKVNLHNRTKQGKQHFAMLRWIKKRNLQKISYGFPHYTYMIFWTNAHTERETDF